MNSMLNWVRGGLALLCFGLLFGTPTRAQETADLLGTVTDASGAVVPSATVTLTNSGTNISQTVLTSGDGNYAFTLLQVGTYTVKVEASGFKTFSAPSIALSAGDRTRVDAKMEVGATSQTVEVNAAAAAALETDTSAIGSLVTTQNVEDLPLNGRNYINLIQMQPGVTAGSPTSIGAGNRNDDRRIAQQFSANGQPDTGNDNLIDGMDNNERIFGGIGVRPSLDAIQEINVQTNKYDASVGRTAGVVVDVITKSGANSFHGSAYEFFRNKVLNANPNYNFTLADNGSPSTACPTVASCAPAANPAFRQNNYGGSLGGPIKKDKTFFFADYEILDFAKGLPAQLFSVPTRCERGLVVCPDGKTQLGDFSDQKDISPFGGGSSSCTPNTTVVAAGTCPYVVIPSNKITPLGRAYFNLYPLPTNAGLQNNYVFAPTQPYVGNTWDGRIDHHFSDKDTIYFRWTHNGLHTNFPTSFPAVQIDNTTGNLEPVGSTSGLTVLPGSIANAGPNHETQEQSEASYVHVFRPNLLLNLKLGVLRFNSESLGVGSDTKDLSQNFILPADGGFPCNPTSCINQHFTPDPTNNPGLANVSFASTNGGGVLTTVGQSTNTPNVYYETSIQEYAGLTWNKGAHSFRFGVGLVRRRSVNGFDHAGVGTFTFSGAYTGYSAGDLLEGLALSMNRNNSLNYSQARGWEPSGFVQDDWRAKPWLTLNLGLRYDIFTAITESHGRLSNYSPYTGLLISPIFPGPQQSGPSAGVPTPYYDFAPRVGFAATLPHNAVLRGGFGMAYYPNITQGNTVGGIPFSYTATCSSQIVGGTTSSCAAQQFDAPQGGTVGQFNSGVVSNFGLAATNANSTVGQTGGSLLAAGLPVPYLNIALATDPANYTSTLSVQSPLLSQAPVSYVEVFTLGLEKQLGANVIKISYVGQLGRKMVGTRAGGGAGAGGNQNLPANPAENHPNLLPMFVGGDTQYFGHLAGYPYFNSTSRGASLSASNGTTAFNSLETSLVRRFNHGLTFNANYVWSHVLDNVDAPLSCITSYFTAPQPCWVDESNGTGPSLSAATSSSTCLAEGPSVCKLVFGAPKYNWGNGAQDVRQRISWGLNYNVPFGKSMTGVAGMLAKGWGVNTTGSWQTGLPFSVYAASNTSGITASLPMLDQIGSGRISNSQRVCPAGTGPGARLELCEWFNYNDFVHPVAGTLGNEHPSQLYGPHLQRIDFSLTKDFPIKEQLHLQFRAEVFNLFNKAMFSSPGQPVSTGNSANGQSYSIAFQPGSNTVVNPLGTSIPPGQINTMNANWNPRQIQFALKLLF